MNDWVYVVETKTLGGLLRIRERFIEKPEPPQKPAAKK
jgi:hypothetical protein